MPKMASISSAFLRFFGSLTPTCSAIAWSSETSLPARKDRFCVWDSSIRSRLLSLVRSTLPGSSGQIEHGLGMLIWSCPCACFCSCFLQHVFSHFSRLPAHLPRRKRLCGGVAGEEPRGSPPRDIRYLGTGPQCIRRL